MNQQDRIDQAAISLRDNLQFIQLGVRAMRGLGGMLEPYMHDNQLNNAFSSEVSAVFSFFGEALEQPSNKAFDAYEAMERMARLEGS
jgi:hypothetical protein